jgi:hypothetical protein
LPPLLHVILCADPEYYFWGYVLGVLAPIWPMAQVSRLLWRRVGVTAEGEHRTDLPLIVGALERVLYISALLGGVREFVGLWLALKVVGGWKGWSEDRVLKAEGGGEVKVHPRNTVNVFLIGNGLSLMNAAAATDLIRLAGNGQCGRGWAVAITAFVATAALWGLLVAAGKAKA